MNSHNFDEPLSMPDHFGVDSELLSSAAELEPLQYAKGLEPEAGPLISPHHDGLLELVQSPGIFSPLPVYSKEYSTPEVSRRRHDPHRTPRNSLYSDSLMPVQPLSTIQPAPAPSPLPPPVSSISAIQALQNAVWSNNPSGGLHRLPPNNINHVMLAVGTAPSHRSHGVSASAPAKCVDRHVAPATIATPAQAPWYPTPMLTPPAPNQVGLTRNISSKRSKARQPAKSSTQPVTTMAAALAVSLGASNPPPIHVKIEPTPAALSPLVQSSQPPVPTDLQDSSKNNNRGKKCVEPGCERRAQSNSRCKAHGGGARCQYAGPEGCTRSSQGGGFCRAHGGGKRCEFPGCTRGQQRKGRCYVHGGIRKCQTDGCEKKDRGNGFCISHGGGKRCVVPGCTKSVRRGQLCQVHEDTVAGSLRPPT
ncbi:hypothetical protein PINS_up005293 [Pythium insidiosum]|nr:hypothetical protein PINS_up005293 [Pythium insidiosum]